RRGIRDRGPVRAARGAASSQVSSSASAPPPSASRPKHGGRRSRGSVYCGAASRTTLICVNVCSAASALVARYNRGCEVGMAYKTVLVHCNDKRRIARVGEAAATIAKRFQAHLIGVSVTPPVAVIPSGMPGTPDAIVLDEHCMAYRNNNP